MDEEDTHTGDENIRLRLSSSRGLVVVAVGEVRAKARVCAREGGEGESVHWPKSAYLC